MRLAIALTVLLMTTPAPAAPLIVAHRGASADAPENTLPAFELAWTQGADAIEGDFHLTRDGHIVCHHDKDTKKTAGRKLIVKDSTLAELRALDVGRWKDRKFAGTRIPTLEEVLGTVPAGKKIYIEIKCGPEIVPPLVRTLKDGPLHDDQITFISFDAEVIRSLKVTVPHLTANWLYSFSKKSRHHPVKDWPQILTTLKEIKADGLGSGIHQAISHDLLAQLNRAGFRHHVWTVNDAPTARRFRELGTDSITTDIPAKLRAALEAE